jgi:hypothetical protein
MATTTMATATMSTPQPLDQPRRLTRAARIAVIIGWSAFLAAAVATMICFAFVDPDALAAGAPPVWWGSRMHVYALGFFFFWLVGMAAAALSWSLARPRRSR